MPRRLNLNFAKTKRLDPRITFTRASRGTYFDAFGVLKSAPANTARFDHDPVTGESKGLLIEEARTNLLLNSASLATQSITTTASARSLSFYGTGTVVLSGTHSATVMGSGAFPTRTTYTYTPSAGTLTLTVTGTVEYANDELGSFATSWIPTTGATATRAADIASMTGANFSSWYRQDEGTFVVAYSGNLSLRAAVVTDGTSSNAMGLSITTSTAQLEGYVGNTFQGSGTVSGIFASGVAYKQAGAYRLNDVVCVLNGELGVVDTAYAIPPVNRLALGNSRLGSQYLNGHIARLAYFPSRLSNAELQALTA